MILGIEEEVVNYSENEGHDDYNVKRLYIFSKIDYYFSTILRHCIIIFSLYPLSFIFRQDLYAVKARPVRSSPATNYFKSWNRYLSPRSDGYGNVDEPNVDIGVIS